MDPLDSFEIKKQLRSTVIIFLEILISAANLLVILAIVYLRLFDQVVQIIFMNILPIFYVWLWHRAAVSYEENQDTQQFYNTKWNVLLVCNIISALIWCSTMTIFLYWFGLGSYWFLLGLFCFFVGICQIYFAIVTAKIGKLLAEEHRQKMKPVA